MKYIIEIEDEPINPGGMDELYRAKNFRSLLFDKVGLSKLTPYTECKNRINVGDEVLYDGCNGEKVRFVVTNIRGEDSETDDVYISYVPVVYTGITSDGEWVSTDKVKKTGRHFDKVAELLEEMK